MHPRHVNDVRVGLGILVLEFESAPTHVIIDMNDNNETKKIV